MEKILFWDLKQTGKAEINVQVPSEWNIRQCRALSNLSGEEFFLASTASNNMTICACALKTDRGFRAASWAYVNQNGIVQQYFKVESTFGTIGKATADNMTAKVVG